MARKTKRTTVERLADAIGVPASVFAGGVNGRLTRRDDLSRPFILDVTKSGHVFVRGPGEPRDESGLPVFSTDTREQAVMIQVHFCRLARDRSGLYRLNECLGDGELEVEDLDKIADRFAAHFARQTERHAHESPKAKAARRSRGEE